MSYTPDGGVIPSGIPRSHRSSRDHYKLFGLYRGVVVRAVYPESPENSRGDRMEYVVRVNGQDYPNVADLTDAGGIYNYRTRIRRGISESVDGNIERKTPREKTNGEIVMVMFLEGNGDIPYIIAGDQHPRHAAYAKVKEADGIEDVQEFNGVEIATDKSSNFSITQVGRKDDKGKIENQDAVGTQLIIKGTGEIEFQALGNTIKYDGQGVSIVDKNNNNFTFSGSGMSMTSPGDGTFEATGKGTFKGKGGTDVGDAASATKVDGTTVDIAGGGVPVAKVGSRGLGIGNLGGPVQIQILDGSPKVKVP